MALNWNKNDSVFDEVESIVYLAQSDKSEDLEVKQDIDECIAKAIELLDENVKDQSMYLLFEWDIENSKLTAVVTDESKKNDSSQVVECQFTSINDRLQAFKASSDSDVAVEDCVGKIRYWIRDNLTTNVDFFQFSLIAAFHSSSRQECVLL